MSDVQRYKADFEALVSRGEEILQELRDRFNSDQALLGLTNPNIDYQPWYTEAHALLKQVLPGRLDEFELKSTKETALEVIIPFRSG